LHARGERHYELFPNNGTTDGFIEPAGTNSVKRKATHYEWVNGFSAEDKKQINKKIRTRVEINQDARSLNTLWQVLQW
jgi:hypothetical protein